MCFILSWSFLGKHETYQLEMAFIFYFVMPEYILKKKKNTKTFSLDGISCVNLYTRVNIYDCAANFWNIFCNGKDDSSSKSKW